MVKKQELSEYRKKEKTISLMYRDTIFASIKEGIANHFIIPYALALRAGSEYIAIISTAPQLIGSFMQLFSSDVMSFLKSRKIVIVFSAFIDALLWLPILLIPFVWGYNYMLLLNFLIIQAIANSMLNPCYNSLLGDLMPTERRGEITGKLNKIAGITSFSSSIIAGFILAVFRHIHPLLGFSLVFFIAFVSRIVSAFLRSRFYEPKTAVGWRFASILNFTLKIHKSNFGKFVLYVSLMKFAVGISGPFFTVYMLKQLNLDYLTFSLINGGAILSSFMVFKRWGRSIDRRGSRRMLGITGFLVVIVPVLWIIFNRPIILFIIELFSGAVWAGYNLSVSNFIIDATDNKNRLVMISYYNFFIGLMTFTGALAGGFLIMSLPHNIFGNVFFFVFGLSAILRLTFSAMFLPLLKEEKFVDIELKGPRAKMIVSVMPKQGAVFEYIPRKK